MKTRLRIAAVLPALLLLMGARQVPLVNPDPISVPSGVTPVYVGKAVKAAFLDKGWTIDTDEPGLIEATLHLRTHTAKVEATYDQASVRLKYVSSVNLLYEDKNGELLIHRNYLNWLGNIVNGIKRNLALAPTS